MLGRKAQSSAPFELLVAVIIMGFVIFFGMNALHQLSEQQCEKELDRTMHAIVNSTELVVNQRAYQTFELKIPNCYSKPHNYDRPRLYFVSKVSQTLCSAYCKGYRESCMLLTFESAEESRVLCVNISVFTVFPEANTGYSGCPPRDGFKLMQPGDELPEGFYSVTNSTPIGQLTPYVCFYKQEK